MIPDRGEPPLRHEKKPDEAVAEGYKECAAEALRWLSNLGYEPGHPLLRSLVAHLTKKRAYLEKMDLERYLVGKSCDADPEDAELCELSSKRIRENRDVQKALVEAAFRGCDLKYV